MGKRKKGEKLATIAIGTARFHRRDDDNDGYRAVCPFLRKHLGFHFGRLTCNRGVEEQGLRAREFPRVQPHSQLDSKVSAVTHVLSFSRMKVPSRTSGIFSVFTDAN